MEFLFVIAGVAIAIGIGMTKNRNQAINRGWGSAAQKLDLSLRQAALGTTPQLSGFVSGHDLTVDIEKKYRGKNKTARTRFRLGMAPLGLGLKLKRERFFDGIGKAFGSQDIKVGDAAFDRQVLVKGDNETVIREYLTPERCRTIQNFLSAFSGAAITDDEILLTSRGYVREADDVLGTINAMLFVAQTLSEMRDDAEPDATLTPVDELEIEPSAAQAEQPLAAPPGSATLTDSRAPTDSPALADFCDAVFAPRLLSFDSTRTFKNGFAGKRVIWSGTLESASPYAVDFDFGSKGGVRAVLTLDANGNGQTGARDVKAVVGFPVGTNGLDTRIGQRVAFAGTLRKVDGFGRKVFVADAELAG